MSHLVERNNLTVCPTFDYNYIIKNKNEKEGIDMVNQKIEDLRKKLNDLIESGADFEEIKKVSWLLDECLVEFYNNQLEKE